MPQQVENEPSLTGLVTGIVHDAQELIRQQLTLFQVELKNDLRRTAMASIPLALGAIVGLISLIVLAHAGALGLIALWPDLHPAGAYAIVGGILLVIGVGLAWWAKSQFDSFNPLPEQSIEGLKENIQWKANNASEKR